VGTHALNKLLQQLGIGSIGLGMQGGANVVQNAHDTRGSLLLHQVAHGLRGKARGANGAINRPGNRKNGTTARASWTLLLKKSIGVQLMPSRTYSSCSACRPNGFVQREGSGHITCRQAPTLAHSIGSGYLEGEVDEDLLELLIDKVDAKLFKPGSARVSPSPMSAPTPTKRCR
jgi:hypothetical protein